MRRFLGCLTACLTASTALGHPGHGVTEGDSAVHYLVEPLHIGPVVILLAAGLATFVWIKRRNRSLRREQVRRH